MKYLDSKHQVIDDTDIEAKANAGMAKDKQKQTSKKEYVSFKLYIGEKGPKKEHKEKKKNKKKEEKKKKSKKKKLTKKELKEQEKEKSKITQEGIKRVEELEKKLQTSKIKVNKAGREVKDIKPKKKKQILIGGVSLTDKMMFMDNLSTMMTAGLALAPAIKTLVKETKNKKLANILEHFYELVENGQLLSVGMKRHPKVFPEMIIATVEVGENTGMLADTLGHLAEILKAQKRLRSKVISALMYPSIVLIAVVVVSLFLALFVFPQMVVIFEGSNVNLPFILVAVQFLNETIRAYGWFILAGLIGVVVLVRYFFTLKKPRLWLHTVILKMPVAGNIIKELSITRFAGNLNVLLSAGLAIVESLRIVAKTVNNDRYRKVVLEMSSELEKGVSLHESMAARPDLFPSITIQLCQVGETTGELENILKKISEYYEERVSAVLANLSMIIEPALLIIVGLVVGFIAVSVISPLYELTNSFA
jgi:type IV pilus assembly protein PilC